jgi:hypothetical protein
MFLRGKQAVGGLGVTPAKEQKSNDFNEIVIQVPLGGGVSSCLRGRTRHRVTKPDPRRDRTTADQRALRTVRRGDMLTCGGAGLIRTTSELRLNFNGNHDDQGHGRADDHYGRG